MEQKANDLTASYETGIDLRGREQEILDEAKNLLDFIPSENGLLNQTHWWGLDKVPAFQWAGTIHDTDAILKVQGVKPETSEITALQRFDEACAGSEYVRPPAVLAAYPWNDDKSFELLAVERLRSAKLINLPTNQDEVATYGKIFASYRDVAAKIKPWFSPTDESIIDEFTRQIRQQQKVAREEFADNPHHSKEDAALIEAGLAVLSDRYVDSDRQFQHVHISSDDVFLPNGDDPRYVYTSNFVWDWLPPFHDAGIAHFHFPRLLADRYDLASPELVTGQTLYWQQFMDSLPTNDSERRQLQTMQLRHTISNLSLSVYTMDHPDSAAAAFVVSSTRDRLKTLLAEL